MDKKPIILFTRHPDSESEHWTHWLDLKGFNVINTQRFIDGVREAIIGRPRGVWALFLEYDAPAILEAAQLKAGERPDIRLAAYIDNAPYSAFHDPMGAIPRWQYYTLSGVLQSLDFVLTSSVAVTNSLLKAPGCEHIRTPYACGFSVRLDDIYPTLKLLEYEPAEYIRRDPVVVWPYGPHYGRNENLYKQIKAVYAKKYPEKPVKWVDYESLGGQLPGFADWWRYYGEARVVLSTGLRSDFDQRLMEGGALGAYMVAPDRPPYTEYLDSGGGGLYKDADEAAFQIRHFCWEHIRPPIWRDIYESGVRLGAKWLSEKIVK